MKILKYKDRIGTIAYYTGLILEIYNSFSGYMYGGAYMPYVILAGMACLALAFVLSLDVRDKKAMVMMAIILIYGLICYYFQRSALVLRIALVVLPGRKQDMHRIVSVFFYGTAAIMLIGMIASFMGIGGPLSITDLYRNEPEKRYAFGFRHPNGFALFIFRTFLLGLYALKDRLKLWSLALYAAVIIVFQLFAGSKAGIAFTILVVICRIWGHYVKGRIAPLLLSIGAYIMMAVEAVLVIMAGNQNFFYQYQWFHIFWFRINNVVTGRLMYSRDLFNSQSLTFFGIPTGETLCEIGYINAMFAEGMVFLALYIIILVILIRYYRKHNDTAALAVIIGILAYTMAESFLSYANKNVIWLLCIGVIAAHESGHREISDSNE